MGLHFSITSHFTTSFGTIHIPFWRLCVDRLLYPIDNCNNKVSVIRLPIKHLMFVSIPISTFQLLWILPFRLSIIYVPHWQIQESQHHKMYLPTSAPSEDSDRDCANAQSDQNLHLAHFWTAKDAIFLHADNKDIDQTARMRMFLRRLLWVLVGLKCQLLRFLNSRHSFVSRR